MVRLFLIFISYKICLNGRCHDIWHMLVQKKKKKKKKKKIHVNSLQIVGDEKLFPGLTEYRKTSKIQIQKYSSFRNKFGGGGGGGGAGFRE